MFLLNAGRYIVADPALVLNEATCKKLWGSEASLEAHALQTENGLLLALPTGKRGEFQTDLGRPIATETGHIAFVPYLAAEKLLPFGVIRLTLDSPALLFIDSSSRIVLDGKLTIFC